MTTGWKGVFPAVTTQFNEDLSVDISATQRVQDALVNDGVNGLIVMGTCGENNSLDPDEKRTILKAAVEVVNGRVPVVTGVSEFDTRRAVAYARDAEKLGADGLMLLPAMVYVPKPEELIAHFRTVAEATSLPIMLYNNPPAYRVNIGADVLKVLADVPNIKAVKESAPDPRRFTDLINAFGDRFDIFAGLDDVALEGLMLGARAGSPASPAPSRRNPCNSLRPLNAATGKRPAGSTAGSCRFCISMPSTTSCSLSSSPSRSWAAAPNVSACRGCRFRARGAPKSSPWSRRPPPRVPRNSARRPETTGPANRIAAAGHSIALCA